ncbi:acetamidase/formamidase family protein [Chloroflexota bacterium]
MSQRKIHRLEPSIYQFTFGPNEPALRVKSGDIVVAPTRDAAGFNEKMEPLPEEQKPRSEVTFFCERCPLVGPIYIEEAEPGDTLAVTIQKIELNRNYAWSRHKARFGCLTGEVPGKELLLNEPVPEKEFDWQLDLKRNVGILEFKASRQKRIEISLHPFLGSIGVAPRFGCVETSLTPGEYGGNMDCVETKESTILYLPVWARGAYFNFGDVHAAQGDGEICGIAMETTAEVTCKLDVLKGRTIEWPRLEDDTHIMTTGSGRPLIDCIRVAQVELVKWLVDDYGFEKWEAFQVISQVSTMRIGNIVDPNYTVVAKFPKKYLTDQ